MIAAVLGGRYRVFKTPGNLNGQLGVPMCFLNMEDGYEAAVIEMGISQFGEMRRLTEIVRPKIAVFTNIGHAHLEFLGDRDGVLRAKGEILEGMGSDGVVICNGDDDKLRAKDFGCRTVRFGLDPTLDVYAENVSVSPDLLSQSCDVVAGDRRIHVEVPAYGEYMVYAVLAAVAVGLELGLSDEEIRRGALDYEPVGHRSRVKKLRRWTLVDDAYNGNPDANRAAIRSLEGFEGRRVCIMGDMKEMGPESPQMHFDLGRFAGSHGVDLLLSTGGFAPELCAGAGEIGHCFESKEALIAALPGLLREGDVILVKASRSCRFEDIVAAIEAMDK